MCEKMTFVKLLPRAQYSIFRLTIRSDGVGMFQLFQPPCFQCVYMSMILPVKKRDRWIIDGDRETDRGRLQGWTDTHRVHKCLCVGVLMRALCGRGAVCDAMP